MKKQTKRKNPYMIVNNFRDSNVSHMVADFETCINEFGSDVRVWAWGLADMFTDDYTYGTSIDSFISRLLADKQTYDIGIHNLKFDGNYILPQLFKMGYQYVDDKTFLDMFLSGADISKVFTHNITAMGQWFNITVGKPRHGKKGHPPFVYFWDTLKLFPETLREVGLHYCRDHQKLDEDADFYNQIRPEGHELTDEEKLYLQEDCLVLAEALRSQYKQYGKLFRTRASKAFSFFKECCNGDADSNLYQLKYEGIKQLRVPEIPTLEDYEGVLFSELPWDIKKRIMDAKIKITPTIDYYIPDYYTWSDLKHSYRGGIAYVNPYYAETSINENIVVLDVNSMYPACLRNCKMPFGKFEFKKGKPENIPNTTWIACARVSFKLKHDYNLPCIQIKDRYGREWLRESTDYRKTGECNMFNEDIITFTAVDYETFCENYDFTVHEWIFHYQFNLFSNQDGKAFVDKYYQIKQDADRKMKALKKESPDTFKEHPDYIQASLERQEAKVILNSAYGKMGTKYVLLSKDSSWDEEIGVLFSAEETEFNKEPDDPSHYYLPYASFVTSYARQMLVRAWNKFKGKAIYCDTDSIHAICGRDNLPEELHPDIDWSDSGELGLWKVEGEFKCARYIRAKTYIEVDYEDKPHITCAGAPDQVKELMTWENFRVGFNAWNECEKQGLEIKDHSKLTPKHYPSGVDLIPTNFQIL